MTERQPIPTDDALSAYATPFDIIDMGFGLAAAISGSPPIFAIAIGQFLARRSPLICQTVLSAIGAPDTARENRVISGILPGTPRAIASQHTAPPSSATEPSLQPVEVLESTPMTATLPIAVWLQRVNNYPDDAPHTLVIGGTGSGKTTLVQAIIATRHGQVAIADPKWQPGKWGGLPCTPIDDDGGFTQIDALLGAVLIETRRRLVALKRGQTTFTPLTLVVDEFVTVKMECPTSAPALLKLLGSIGRELRVRLIAISTSERVRALGIEGEGDIRENYTIIRMGKPAIAAQPACAQQPRPACLEWRGVCHPIATDGVHRLAGTSFPSTSGWIVPSQTAPSIGRESGTIAAAAASSTSSDDPLLTALLAHTSMANATGAQRDPQTSAHTSMPSDIPDRDAENDGMDDERLLRTLVRRGVSANKIYDLLGGDRNRVLTRVRTLRAISAISDSTS